MVNKDKVFQDLRGFIANELLNGQDSGLTQSTPLLEWGILDSLSMVSLLTFVEEQFDLAMPNDFIKPDNFENLEVLTDLVMAMFEKKHTQEPKPKSPDMQTETMVRVLASYGAKPSLIKLENGTEQHSLRASGTKPTWVLLPPLGNPSTAWGEILRSIIDEQDTIAVDLVGFGLSTSTKTSTPTYSDHLQDIIALIDQNINGPIILVGSSIVSSIATEVARQRPSLVKALIIVGFGLIEDSNLWWKQFKELSNNLDSFLQYTYYQPPTSMPLPLRQLLEEAFSRDSYNSFLDESATILNNTFENINIPTLLVAGENDRLITKTAVEAAAAQIPNVRVEWLARCGHFLQMERPYELLTVMKRFLQSLPDLHKGDC